MADGEINGQLVSLLAWYRELGVDAAIAETATDWLERSDRAPGAGFSVPDPSQDTIDARSPTERAISDRPPGGRPPAAPEPSRPTAEQSQRPPAATPRAPTVADPARRFPTATPDAAVTNARRLASAAADIAALEVALRSFEDCALRATAKNLCFWRGAPTARLMLIGEAPGREEDIEGRPFVGPAGKLLDKMLAAAGIAETDVHITNIVYWRPPGNRTPTPQEAQMCRPFLERQIELVEPEIVVALGGAAAKHLLDVADGILKLRGKWRDLTIAGRTCRAMATLHPAYLLRTPIQKRLAWRDLLEIRAALGPPKP